MVLLLYPLRKLDLLKQNFSTLTLQKSGYLYLLRIGFYIAFLLFHEMKSLLKTKAAMFLFLSFIMGILIPHHVPYDLQGNLHLFFAYASAFLVSVITYLTIEYFQQQQLKSFFIMAVFLVALLYMKNAFVNTLSEIILMFSILIVYLILYLQKNQ